MYFSCRIEMEDGTVYRSGLNYYSPEAFVADTIKTPEARGYQTACAVGVYSEMARIRFIENANK